MGRCELATRPTGSAHGLDDGTPPARLILRGRRAGPGGRPHSSRISVPSAQPEQSWLQTEGSIRQG
ncbi:TIGR02679 domain-containing protein [Streptomyces sp. NPDC059629]|uniref:TIGR02679 domain-containing protein n=1 Tax=Streptomyces sp. NPDC059629 TaxID=3346889 RepID=UPI00367C2072